MTDERDETAGTGVARPGGSSAASAARRARRIGGRPSPSPSVAGAGARSAAAKAAPKVDPETATQPVATPAAKRAATPAAKRAAAPAAKRAATPVAEPAAKPSHEPIGATTPAAAETVKIDKPARARRGAAKAAADRSGTDDAPAVLTQVPGWLLWLPATVLAAVAVVFAIAVGVTAHGVWYAEPSTTSARDQVLAAAKTCVAATNSYKYTTIVADERKGLLCTTGGWTTNYRKAMEQILIPSSKTLKSTQVAQINAAGVQSVQSHGSVWKLLVFGQVSVTSVNQKTARPDPFSAVVTMQKVGGKWKVADIDQVLKPIKTSG